MRAAIHLALLGSLVASCDPGGWRSVETGTKVPLRSVFVEAKDRVWVAGDNGTVLFYDGHTITDTSTSAGVQGNLPSFHGIAASAGETTITGDRGFALTRLDTTWRHDDTPLADRMLTMIRPAPSVFYAAGERGRVMRRPVGSSSWERIDVNAPGNSKITGGWSNGERTMAFSTDRGIVIELVDGEWIAQTVATNTSTVVPLFGVWSSTRGADLLTVGLAGQAYRRPAGEAQWELEDTHSNADLYGIFGNAADDVYAVGRSGTILHFDGSSWNPVASTTGQDLFSIHGLQDGSMIAAVGDHGEMVIFEQ